MSENYSNIIGPNTTIKEAMVRINNSPLNSTLYIVENDTEKVIGTLTDGDIRRGLLNSYTISDKVSEIMRTTFRYLSKGNYYNEKIEEFRKMKLKTIPLLDEKGRLLKVYDITQLKNVLPVDVILMAGGKGERLLPMTETTPKPLLKIGEKPILELNIDRLSANGIENFYISINYLGHLIKDYFGNGSSKNIKINYVEENEPLGTIGAVSKISDFGHENILVMNSDLLTNIDFASFYQEFITKDADIAVATIPYKVSIPYAVIEADENIVKSLREKPTYTYYSNAGIYLIKKSLINKIPKNTFFNATDFIDKAIEDAHKIISYPVLGYWLDIGRPDDFIKAQEEIKHVNFF